MGRALIITHPFPPILSSESIIVTRLVKYLNLLGWETVVLCSQPPKSQKLRKLMKIEMDKSLLELLPTPIKIYRRENTLSTLTLLSMGKFMPSAGMFPDYWVGWFPKAVRLASRLLVQERFDVLLTRSNPMSVSFVGLALKKRFSIPWVAYLGDPWTDNPYVTYQGVTKALNLKWEKRVMEAADALYFVAEKTKKKVGEKYDSSWFDKKAYVIPHSFEKEFMDLSIDKKYSKLKIMHTGQLYAARRPDMLFTALQELYSELPGLANELEVEFVGKVKHEFVEIANRSNIQSIVTFKPEIPYVECLKYMKSADVLLVIDAPSDTPSLFLPLKLIEYLGSGNPILALTPRKGETATLVNRLNCWVAEPDNVLQIKNSLLEIIKKWREGSLIKPRYSLDDIKRYDPNQTTAQLIKIFDQICK